MPLRLLGIGLPLTIALGAARGGRHLRPAERRGGRHPGGRPGADRRRAGAGGRHRAARPGEDPPGAQRRERAQRRDLRPAAVRGRRRRRRGIGDLGGPQRGDAPARGDRLRGRRRGGRRARGRGDRHPRRPPRPDRGPWRQVIPAAGAALAYGTASALGGSGFIAAFVAGMTFRLALGRDPERHQRAQRAGGRRAQRRHLRALRGHPARPGARRAELGARPVRGPQPHARADAPGRDRDARARAPGRRRSASSAGSAPAGWHRSCSR